MSGHSVTEWIGQLELRAIGTLVAVLGRVELEAAVEGKSHGHLRAGGKRYLDLVLKVEVFRVKC